METGDTMLDLQALDGNNGPFCWDDPLNCSQHSCDLPLLRTAGSDCVPFDMTFPVSDQLVAAFGVEAEDEAVLLVDSQTKQGENLVIQKLSLVPEVDLLALFGDCLGVVSRLRGLRMAAMKLGQEGKKK